MQTTIYFSFKDLPVSKIEIQETPKKTKTYLCIQCKHSIVDEKGEIDTIVTIHK